MEIYLNPGRIITIPTNNMRNYFPFYKCNLFIERTEYQFNIGSNNLSSGDKWSMFKKTGIHFLQCRRGVMLINTAQLHSSKPELRFSAGSNPAGSVSEIRDGEDF